MNFEADVQLPEPDSERWRILRAGIQNLWEYDDQRFTFHRGRLLLRGQNESGKTKALELLLPFLLDASLQPSRLDPFGSTGRLMHWNLLSDANAEVNLSVGYVWLEFGRRDGEQAEVVTLGAGLKARRSSKDVEDWYFLTPQRIDRDLSLWDERRIPLMRPALETALRPGGGQVLDRAQYRRAVNARLFQMPEEQYATLIDALLQLRRPHLSEKLEPDALSLVLSASLPPPDPKVVGTLAEGFERLDRHRLERQELSSTLQAVSGFLEVYREYAGALAKARAQDLTRAESAFHSARAQLKQAQQEQADAAAKLALLVQSEEQLGRELEELDERIATLKSSEAYRAVELVDRAEKDAREAQDQARRAGERAERDQSDTEARGEKLRVAEARQKDAELKLAEHRDLAARRAEEAALSELHAPLDRMLQSSAITGARGILQALLGRREQVLLRLAERTRAVHSAQKEEERAAERLREAIERQKQQVETLRDEERKHTAARESFAAHLSAWVEMLQVLPLDRELLLDAAPAHARGQADAAAESARRSLEDEAAPLHGAAREVERELGTVEARRQELQARAYQPPCAPPWRGERPAERAGAPLYLLCDFGGGDADQQANVEAALEAAGLLDAWMMPDGTVLSPESDDAVLLPSAVPPQGLTLRNILRPVEEAPVAVCVIDAVLGSIGLLDVADAHTEATCWVSVDGRFRNGPLEGSHRKAAAEYIGAANREKQRLLRLAELDARRATLEARQGELRAALESVRARRDRVAEELRSFPDASPVLEADIRVQTARSILENDRAARTRAQDAFDQHEAKSREALSARERFAVEQGLRQWVDSVEVLKERTLAYQIEAERLLSQKTSAEGARRACDECGREWDAASKRWQAAAEEAEDAKGRARRATAHAQAIKDAHGSTLDEVLGQVREAESRRSEAEGEIKERRKQKTPAEQSAIRAEVAAKTADTSVAECEGRRRSAEVSMRALVARGLTAAAGLELAMAGAAESWSYTDLLVAARRVDERLATADPSETARDKALNKVAAEHQTLARMLRADVRVLPEQRDGIVEYQALWNGRVCRLLDLSSELEGEVAARDRLLSEREHELFESFLSGEAHQHLRARLRAAFDLVSRMTGQLEAHPTSSGMMLKLHWAVAEEAPAGTREAVDLLLRSGELLTDDNRAALASFLKERLSEARRDEQAGTLLDRLLEVLDYRRWHKFTVKYKTAQHDWRTLTRKAHQTGSGGQKAVMLHVPLFAAAAAFYESAANTSPRLILLDEAFAGIDKETRGQLMGLLSEFDLDFMMTSFEEWGFYSQLDGLSTYNLSREQGMRGVHAEWFIWDGREAMHVEAP